MITLIIGLGASNILIDAYAQETDMVNEEFQWEIRMNARACGVGQYQASCRFRTKPECNSIVNDTCFDLPEIN